MEKSVYIADDQQNIRQLIQSFLEKEGYRTAAFPDGESLLAAFLENPADLVILDIMMPGMDGLSLCALLRQRSPVPIIIVSAKDSELDRVAGITIGGDDYLTKPFSPLELVARVKAQFRREQLQAAPREDAAELHYGPMTVDVARRQLMVNGQLLGVTPAEFDFLTYLVRNQSRAVSKSELLRELWEFDFEADTRAADDLVKRLRKKLREQGGGVSVETVWGFGYRIGREDDHAGNH